MARYKMLALLGVLLVMSLICAPRLSGVVQYNRVMVQLAKNVLQPASIPDPAELTPEQRRMLEAELSGVQTQQTNTASVRYHLGQLAFWSGDYPSTIERLKLSYGQTQLPLANPIFGYALWKTGQQDQAVEVWRTTEQVDHYFLMRAAKAEDIRTYQTAEEYYQIAERITPDWDAAKAGYWFAHSMNLLEQQVVDTQLITDSVEQALQLSPNSFSRQLRLGVALYVQKEYALAEAPLLRSIELSPRARDPRYYAGLLYYATKRYQLAEMRLREVVELTPTYARGQIAMARTYVQLGKNDEALIHYREAIRLSPDDEGLAREVKAFETRVK